MIDDEFIINDDSMTDQSNSNVNGTSLDCIDKENDSDQINSTKKEIKNNKFLVPNNFNEENNANPVNENDKLVHTSINEKNDNTQINAINEEIKNDNKLLVPIKTVEFSSPENLKANAIKQIERKISICKNRIAKLDEEEVCGDSNDSPYIKSEKYVC